MYLLSVLEEVLPIGPEEWDEVVNKHAVGCRWIPGRDVDSIRRKFASLHRKQIPTGDPNMPEDVKLAKRIKYMIGDKANIGDGEEEYQLEQAEFVGYESEQLNRGVLTQRRTNEVERQSVKYTICFSAGQARAIATWRQHWSNTVASEFTQARVTSCGLASLLWCCSTRGYQPQEEDVYEQSSP